jgi:hypothetical protein
MEQASEADRAVGFLALSKQVGKETGFFDTSSKVK